MASQCSAAAAPGLAAVGEVPEEASLLGPQRWLPGGRCGSAALRSRKACLGRAALLLAACPAAAAVALLSLRGFLADHGAPVIGRRPGGGVANALRLDAAGLYCSGDYGAAVGGPVCCGQQGAVAQADAICPSQAPTCVGFAPGQWGTCVAQGSPAPAPQQGGLQDCLCLFDVDRTLTTKQGASDQCPGTQTREGIFDSAYAGGTLVLSEFGLRIQDTFCGHCYRGIITAGPVSGEGSTERNEILQRLGGPSATLSSEWSAHESVTSSMVWGSPDGLKQETATAIVQWFQGKGITIPPARVYFFDDRDGNVPPFQGTGYNARQVSCSTRDGLTGNCGAALAEIVEEPGVHTCQGPVA